MGQYTKYNLSGKSCLAIARALAQLLTSVQCGIDLAYKIRASRQKALEEDVFGLHKMFPPSSSEQDPDIYIDPSTRQAPEGADIKFGPKGARQRATVGAMIYWGDLDAHISQRHKNAEYQRKCLSGEKFDGHTTYFMNDQQIIELGLATLKDPDLLYDDTNYPESFSLFRTFPQPVGIRPGQTLSAIRGVRVAATSADGDLWRLSTIHPLDHQPLSVKQSKMLKQPSNETGIFGLNFS